MLSKIHLQTSLPPRGSLCAHCGQVLEPGSLYISSLSKCGEEWRRSDSCLTCSELAPEERKGDLFSFWRGSIPLKKEKLRAPDERALELFKKLAREESDKSQKILHLLALYLERKRQIYRRIQGKERVICEIPETGEAFILQKIALSSAEGESLSQELVTLLDG